MLSVCERNEARAIKTKPSHTQLPLRVASPTLQGIGTRGWKSVRYWSRKEMVLSLCTYCLCGGFGLVFSRFSVRVVCAWTGHFHWRDQNFALVICKIVTLYLNSLKMLIYVNFMPMFINSNQFYANFIKYWFMSILCQCLPIQINFTPIL